MTNIEADLAPQASLKPARAAGAEAQGDRRLVERFVKHRDEAAFGTLLERYGPMVLAVCRRVLADEHAAEDAFQATFVVLMRKAGSLRKPELLGNWLYGVAYRIALKARASAAKRSVHERRAATMAALEAPADDRWGELRAVLDEELSRLPEKYRAPLVLCYLQGKTNAEAARCLGWPIGSMSWRLHEGREKLRERLKRRARAFPSIGFDTLLVKCVAPVQVPEPLFVATRSMVSQAAGPNTPSGPSDTSVADLVDDALRFLGRTRKRVVAVLATVIALLVLGSGGYAFHALGGPTHFNKNLTLGEAEEGCAPGDKGK